MAEPKKKPDEAKGRRQSKWPKGSKKSTAADSVLLLRQIEAMERHTEAMNRLADQMARRGISDLDEAGPGRITYTAAGVIHEPEQDHTWDDVLSMIDDGAFQDED